MIEQKRQAIHLCLALCVIAILGLAGCGGLLIRGMGWQEIEKARTAMARGDFETALRQNEEVLARYPNTLGDEALFMMGMLYAHPLNPAADRDRALEFFRQLVKAFPESARTKEAGEWILIIEDMAKMAGEMSKMTRAMAEMTGDMTEMRERMDVLREEIRKLQAVTREKDGATRLLRSEMNKKSIEIDELKNRIRSFEEKFRQMELLLERLKGVDLEIEKKKREAIRP